jgi:hypothetical protein
MMKNLTTFAIAAAFLSTCARAIQLVRRTNGEAPLVVGFPIEG